MWGRCKMSIISGAGNEANFNGYLDWKKRQTDEDPLCFSRAIETWREQMLSGGTALTEEEKEKIREMIVQWLYG